MKLRLIVLLLSFFITFSYAKKKPTLIFYCGITMAKPIKEMAKIIEDQYNCTIKISQGGSKDLYDALKLSKKGDLYLPGSASYVKENLKEGLLQNSTYIGFNKAALFVQKNNPKNIQSLDDLNNKNVSTILPNPNSGSIGRMAKKILVQNKGIEFFEQVYDNAAEIGTDSRYLNRSLINDCADLTINWRATAFWEENKAFIDIIELNDIVAPKQELYINRLIFSKHPKIADAFIQFAASKQGQKIMRKYGFLK